MDFKKLLSLIFIAFATFAFAEEPATKVKIYGYVGNDFYYNSRQNTESCDGVVHLFPKAVSKGADGIDANALPQAEMLSVNSRIGLDIAGTNMLGAKSSGKIEADFAGSGTTFFLLRIRQAYMKLNWDKTELLLGQTWHPLFGSVAPTTPSSNGGAPFQPFNRSPQVRVKYAITKTLSATAAGIYEMQYASFGPAPAPALVSASNLYAKNAVIPNGFVGLENKTKHWTTGAGFDVKVIKPAINTITSTSATAYAQFVQNKFTIKGKALYGQNMSNQLMIGGYGISDTINSSYTNFNTGTGWINATYGSKWVVGLLLGYSQNLGTNKDLEKKANGSYTIYGYGTDITKQTMVDKVVRVAPHISYNLPNMKFAVEYDYTAATYGTIKANGRVSSPLDAANHRVLASVSYIF